MTNETAIPADRSGCCPGCTSQRVVAIHGRGLPLDAPTRSEVFTQNEYHIHRCEDCGLVFKDSILSEEQFSHYYRDFEFSNWEASQLYPSERPVLQFLQALPAGSEVLDFGCSSGRLLGLVAKQHRRFGFEINRAAAAEAAKRGICMIDTWAELTAHPATVDALVMIDVFEHIEKPTELLGSLLGLVKPGGSLAIVTGNADCPACQVDLPNFWYFRNIQHVAMITRKYCDFIARRFGLRITKWHECSHYDIGIMHKATQILQQSLYAHVSKSRNSFAARIFSMIPRIQRCVDWVVPPTYNASKDHVFIVFEKLTDCATR